MTYGHIDLIRRGLASFSKVVVGVAVDPGKETLFSLKERLGMLQEVTRRLKHVQVKPFGGLAVDFTREQGSHVILRGLRMLSDFEYEFQMALTNRKLAPDIETVFMMPSAEYSYISSRLIKEAAVLGADLKGFVPSFVFKRLREKLKF